MMKIVVVGGGVISQRLIESKYAFKQIIQFSIRDLQTSPERWSEVQLECENSDAIIYLAYHHKNFFLNIKLLLKVLFSLLRCNWGGKFIFLNTQTALIPEIFKSPKPLPLLLTFDLYTVTKKVQSALLAFFSGKFNILEIYLPVITGLGTKAHSRFQDIALYDSALMPNAANSYFAHLNLNKFVEWIWTDVLGSGLIWVKKSNGQVLKIFIYENLMTFRSYLDSIRKTKLDSNQVITNFLFKYRYSNSLITNFAWHLKMSPIGFLLYVVRYAFDPITKNAMDDKNKQVIESIPKVFIPSGPEYQFLGSSIDLSQVPFEVLKID